MKTIELEEIGKPYKIFAESLEDTAIEQFTSAMREPYVTRGAMMPDAHTGYALPIGAVVETKGVIVPAWVGYDIGCGMCAVPTSFQESDVREKSQDIFDEIYKTVPVGFHVHEAAQESDLSPDDLSERGRAAFEKRKGFRSLGTLGGGNHFIEIGVSGTGQVWIVVHSGSRGVGHGIATEYMKLASPDGKAREDHFGFDIESQHGKDYLNDLKWGLKFALENRKKIVEAVCFAMIDMGVRVLDSDEDGAGASWDHLINRNHNHAEVAGSLVIHRKGATHAEEGMAGVIPGNMRDGSFIVVGKGNAESLCSSSHGAGRVMGRKQAKRELSCDEFTETMQGITAKVGDETLDEAPLAYKNIFEVMEQQEDLVSVVSYIKPIINIKG